MLFVVDYFIECLKEKKKSDIYGVETLKTIRVIFASIESYKSGRSIVIKQD